MPALDGRNILAMLEEEAGLCRTLSDLRSRQRKMIDAGDAEGLLDILGRKQQAIDRVGRIEEQLRDLKAGWDRRKHEFAAAERVAIGDAFREIRELLGELVAHENDDAEALAGRTRQAQDQVEQFDQKRRLRTAYGPSAAAAESRYVDRTDA